MKYTENYHLPNWAKTDRIQMEIFNDMTAKLDAALNEHKLTITTKAEQRDLTALAMEMTKYGNCRIVYTTYVGDGTYGQGHETTLTFDARPLLIFVGSSNIAMGYLIRGNNPTMPIHREGGGWFTTWGDKNVSWYSPDAVSQFNSNNNTYYVVAFLADD